MLRRKTKTVKDWEANERSALRPTPEGDAIENLLRVPLNGRGPKDGYFDLYYFVKSPEGGPARKTVLFCTGGPGEIVRVLDTTFAGFLSANEYNVVFFHLRGTGFSQISPSNRFDRFLRTSYAVQDIEAIRRGFLGEDGKWDGIIAWSYGTVLAQQYAHSHSDRVRKLILLAPLSRHMFKKSVNAFDDLNQEVRKIHEQSLERIYNTKEFEDDFGVVDAEKKRIIEKLFGMPNDPKKKGIFETTEDAFGSIQFVVNDYFDLKKHGELRKYGIHKYGRDFFQRLRDLRRVGSSTLPENKAHRLEIGKELRDELLDRKKANHVRPDKYIQDSHRVFYVINTLDGINPRFLKELSVAGAKDIRGALRRSGGDAHLERGVNKWLEKVRISDREKIEPWDPAKYSHGVPTLILKGEADPVTAGGQAEYIFSEALKGPRTLIEFPGIGHGFSLPVIEEKDDIPILSGVIRFDPRGISSGEMRTVKGVITGRRLNEKLRMDLEPPPDLKSLVKIDAVAILEEEKIPDTDKARNNIVALIKNTSGGVLRLNLENSYWPIRCYFFAGSVRFSSPTGSAEVRLNPGEVRTLYGTIVYGGRNSQRLYRLEPKDKLDDGLELLGFNIVDTNRLHLWLKATQQLRDPATRKWTISRGSFEKTFRVTLPSLEEGEVFEVDEAIDGLHLGKDEEIVVANEEIIDAYVSQEETTETVPIILINDEDKAFNGRPGNWLIENPFFSVSLKVDPPQIPPKGGVKTSGTIKGLWWKRWLEIKHPVDLDSELELLGFNILGGDKISLLLKNNGRQAVKGGTREWIYIDPTEKDSGSSLGMRRPVLNRLIYSFLVRDTAQFSNEKHNENLKVIREAFKGDSVVFKIKYSDREKASAGHKVVNKRCLIGLDSVRRDSLLKKT
jgi:pimeloyl-ACP methyl ester carboxylesterase